jgi:chromosome partitioning protein
MALAQGLSMQGHRVLAVDADPQGSLSMLFGLLPESDVPESETLLPVLRGDLSDAIEVARPTYWPNIDLIASSPPLFGAEYSLYAMALEQESSSFLTVLDRSLNAARQRYDVIIIDTPPSLSCLTINALLAANGLIIPLPPTALDFNSLAQLWALLSEIGRTCTATGASGACFDFVHILPSRVDRTDAAASVVLRWMEAVYGDLVMPIEIPKTVATSRASAEFGTVFDVCDRTRSTRTHQRAQRAYDQLVAAIDASITQSWRKQASGGLL